MFKLIAIKPLQGCQDHIRKCLKTDMMYYFCNDYYIAEDESYIERRSKNIQPLKKDFFLGKPQVNISAVVGMNGDGKSTLVELMMRLVNNCAISNELAATPESLRRVEGVKASLYYMIDNTFYKLTEAEGDEFATVWELVKIAGDDLCRWETKPQHVNIHDDHDSFFFTLVSNYSHYAYNTRDFKKEWTVIGNEENDDEKCWLHYIFHKNDGYMAPITLHPYRYEGNIDVNREKELSKQRLLSLFLNAENPEKDKHSIRRVNDKDAELIVLKPLPYSKLQQKCIVEFFAHCRRKNNFTGVLNQIKKADNDGNFNDIEYENLKENVLPYVFEGRIDELLEKGNRFKRFVVEVIDWLEKKQPEVFPETSDIEEVFKQLQLFERKYRDLNLRTSGHGLKRKYNFLKHLNSSQLARLLTLYQICILCGHEASLIIKDFKDLSYEEKCDHYIIYKTWSILTTYPQYKAVVFSDEEQGRIRECSPQLEDAYKKLKEDKTSHVTRKLRQVENYMAAGFEGGDMYERIGKRDDETGELLVMMDDLKNNYEGKVLLLDNMPPALYQWDMKFKKVGENECDIDFDSFSSGEKQMLNSIGAVIYHLQNLNTTAVTHYSNINIVLEEIELYYHPECQRNYINMLLHLLGGVKLYNIGDINIVFVTHSPFILSDIPKCNVLFLRDGMDQHLMQENTFGANIHAMLKNGFFLPNLTMGEFAYQKINGLFEKMNTGDFSKDEMDDIYQEILLVGEPFLRGQLLSMFNNYRGHQA